MSKEKRMLSDNSVQKVSVNVPIKFEKKSFEKNGQTVNYSELFALGTYDNIELDNTFFELDGKVYPVVIKKLKLDILIPKTQKADGTPKAVAYCE